MNQTPVELKRDTASKFNKVTGRRHSALLLQPISICPAVDITEFPMLRCSFEEEADEPTLTTTTSTEQPQLLRRSLAKYNLTTKNQHQAQPKISHRQKTTTSLGTLAGLRKQKPKMTSSMISVVKESPDQITFHVENASTPKRVQRSSTPRTLLRLKKNILTSTLLDKKSFKASIAHLSVIKEKFIIEKAKLPDMVVGEKRKKLSSKSTQTGAKRCHKAKKAEFFSSTGISCEVNLDQIGEGAALGVARHGRRSLRRAEWKSLKYPVRYAPNVKLTDINRLEYCVEDMYEGSFPASAVTCSFGKFGRSFESRDGRPASGGCYSCGEYKFWII